MSIKSKQHENKSNHTYQCNYGINRPGNCYRLRIRYIPCNSWSLSNNGNTMKISKAIQSLNIRCSMLQAQLVKTEQQLAEYSKVNQLNVNSIKIPKL